MNIIKTEKYVLTRVEVCAIILIKKGEEMIVAKKVIKALKDDGWEFVGQKGSHMKFKKGTKTCIVPYHTKDIPKGTLLQIIKSTGIKI